MMEKLKENKIWITVVVFGVIIVGILLLMLHQQKQSTPAAQESSYSSSVQASSSSQESQDKQNEKEYAKKAAKMKGHVLDYGSNRTYYTSWTKSDLKAWAEKYSKLDDAAKRQASTNFGTKETVSNSNTDTGPLDEYAEPINNNDFSAIDYYETVKDFNKAYPAVDPDTIQK